MKSFFHIPFFCVLLMSVFASGCTSSVELATLDTQIDRQWRENQRILTSLVAEVDYMGNRPADLQIFEQTRHYLKVRKMFFSAEMADSLDFKFPIKSTRVYQDSLRQIVALLEVESTEQYFENIDRLEKEELLNTEIRRRLLYLNVLQIEEQIVLWGARKVGADCGFCFEFVLSLKSDTVIVGEPVTALLYVTEKPASIEIYRFHDLQLISGEEMIPNTFEPIRSSGILKFTPEHSGHYIFSGYMNRKIAGFDSDYSCRFSFPLVVLDSAQRSNN